MMDWQAQQRAMKQRERQNKKESHAILHNYRGTTPSQSTLAAVKAEDRKKQLDAEHALHSYRGRGSGLSALKVEDRKMQLDAQEKLKSYRASIDDVKASMTAKQRNERSDRGDHHVGQVDSKTESLAAVQSVAQTAMLFGETQQPSSPLPSSLADESMVVVEKPGAENDVHPTVQADNLGSSDEWVSVQPDDVHEQPVEIAPATAQPPAAPALDGSAETQSPQQQHPSAPSDQPMGTQLPQEQPQFPGATQEKPAEMQPSFAAPVGQPAPTLSPPQVQTQDPNTSQDVPAETQRHNPFATMDNATDTRGQGQPQNPFPPNDQPTTTQSPIEQPTGTNQQPSVVGSHAMNLGSQSVEFSFALISQESPPDLVRYAKAVDQVLQQAGVSGYEPCSMRRWEEDSGYVDKRGRTKAKRFVVHGGMAILPQQASAPRDAVLSTLRSSIQDGSLLRVAQVDLMGHTPGLQYP
eukprot:CAMPEP_0116850098 /NCGR_PEP_ID=MMETSP0418-20121206/15968_1 /TAXON_ID=1158023 /ORGANISM="Astrosyne radiata, Strain 13vi08-1A" /LENGTH=465 /DNA_ID=CAMNT_0004481951 /DNA_START=251 /DNA_END=1648 /DNA_ORIENTATION=-